MPLIIFWGAFTEYPGKMLMDMGRFLICGMNDKLII